MSDKSGLPVSIARRFINSIHNFINRCFGFRIRILSVVIFCGSLILTVKLNHLWQLIHSDETIIQLSTNVMAKDDQEATPTPAHKTDTPDGVAEQTSGSHNSTNVNPQDLSHHDLLLSKTLAPDAAISPSTNIIDLNTDTITPEQYQALLLIQNKPESTVKTDTQMPLKAATLQVIESKIDEKIKKLEETKKSLENLVKNVEEKDKANLERLVKMAETMNPEEASKIMETLDLPVLIDLMESIKPKKGAAILSVMDAHKAGYLMNELAKRQKVIKTGEDNSKK